MRILLSIKPEHANKIFSGEKRFEFRKAIFRNSAVKVVVVYATMPIGKVIGEFEIEEVLSASPRNLWSKTKQFSGIPKAFFDEYFRGRETAYAIKVLKAALYKRPMELGAVAPTRYAPQSFRYLPLLPHGKRRPRIGNPKKCKGRTRVQGGPGLKSEPTASQARPIL